MTTREKKKTTAPTSAERGLDQHPRPARQENAPAAAVPDGQALDQHPRPVQQRVSAGTPPASARRAAATTNGAPAAASSVTSTGSNGDETRFPNRIGNYHKGLQHDDFGEVVAASYQSLLDALNTPTQANFEAIQLGLGRKLTNPQAGLATDLEGPDPKTLTMRSAPSLDSPEEAAEAAELYWMALLRDVPFTRFAGNPMVARAAEDLSRLDASMIFDPTGNVTPGNIFRGFTQGDRVGPYLSQFLLLDIPYGSLKINQRQRTVVEGIDYLTRYEEWLDVQNGSTTLPQDEFDGTRRYIRSMRDMGQYVHVDALYEAYLNACLILLGMSAPLDPGNPYNTSRTQIGFGTFGGPHILSLVTEVATRALKAVWYQKWFVHRRLRPEAFGGLVHLKLAGHNGTKKNYPLDNDILNSEAVEAVFNRYGTYLLPMAFPEGSPTHPAYGAGHATVAGACVTILKAWFDEEYILPSPVQPTIDGLELVPYLGSDAGNLTVGGELNKVAANIAIGRNMAGVHWRSDYSESLRLGEQVALCILKKQRMDFHEDWFFTLTTFDNVRVKISSAGVKLLDGTDYPLPC